MIPAALVAALIAAAPEAHPFTAEQDAIADRALNELRAGATADAVRDAALLTESAPENPRAWRVKGLIAAQAGQFEDAQNALTRSLDLGIDRERSADVLAARGFIRLRAKETAAALRDLEMATAIQPDHEGALVYLVWARMAVGNLAGARTVAERVVRIHPAAVEGHHALAAILLEQGEVAGAANEVARLRELGFGDRERLNQLEQATAAGRRRSLLWQVPLWTLSAMAFALLALYLAGSLLSRLQLASLAHAHGALTAGEQTPRERLVLKLYSAVLWFGTVFFYVSVPLLVALSLATGFGVIYLMLAYMSTIPLKLIVILGLAALGGSWAVVRSLFLAAPADDGELRVDEEDEPRLFAVLREVAEAAGSKMVDRVYLEANAAVGVREAGGAVRVLLGRGERVLHLGLWAMQNLSVSQLKAVLAHEYGHFAHGDTRLTPIIGRILPTISGTLGRMAALGYSALVNPVYWYLQLYIRVFAAASGGHSQRRELLADRTAALRYGGEAFGRGLRGVVEADQIFQGQAARIAALLRASGRPCTDLYACLSAARDALPQRVRDEAVEEELRREASRYDSHPPAAARMAAVAGIEPRRAPENELAVSLLAAPTEVTRKITANVVARVESQLGTLPAHKEMDSGAQELFAAGLSLHDAALSLQQKSDPEGDGLLVAALQRLEGAVGANDPLLAVPLRNLSQLHLRLGRKDEAEAALRRSVAVSDDPQWKQEVQSLIDRLRSAA